jgi:general secretion pathway protein D
VKEQLIRLDMWLPATRSAFFLNSPRFGYSLRPEALIYRLLLCLLMASIAFGAGNPVAARLAKKARREQNAGRVVRAYLLYAEAAARDPKTPAYAVNRDALAPLAKLLITAHVENDDVSEDVKAAEQGRDGEDDLSILQPLDQLPAGSLLPPPSLQLSSQLHDFDLRLDERNALAQVAKAYGVDTVFDPDFDSKQIGRFNIDQADFRTAMEALTSVTHTFVFPVSAHSIFVARDSEAKRSEYEPVIEITVSLPETIEPKDVIEAANAVRGALQLRTISWDSVAHTIVIRDRVTKAHIAQSVLASLLLPHAQLSLEVQFIAVDTSVTYEYGLGLQTSLRVFNFAHIGGFSHPLPDLSNVASLLVFGSGTNFFGLALGSTSLIATYNSSMSRVLYDATVVVSEGQTATLHAGEKYPIASALFTGFAATTSALANPISVNQEDLGLVLKMAGRVNGDGDITIDAEAQFKSLGNQTFNTVPAINQREFKGTVRLREGECAVIAGMNEDDHTASKNGIVGLSQIPWLGQVLADNSRSHTTSDTLIVIKPTITRLPMSNTISPQFLLGAARGSRVLL